MIWARKGLRYWWHTLRGHRCHSIERHWRGLPFIIEQGWRCTRCHTEWW